MKQRGGKKTSESEQRLREAAEKELAHRPCLPAETEEKDLRKIVHELQVHQIEIEMQNEELRRAHAELEDSRDKYIDLYDFSPVGYLTFSPQGLIAETNLTAADLLGVPRGKLPKSRFSSYVSPEDRDLWYDHFKSTLKEETGKRQGCDVAIRRDNGSTFTAHLESVKLVLSGGTTVVRSAMSDMTERRRAEERLQERTRQLEDLNRELESFNYSISHDLRAPLRTIDGFSRMLLKEKLEEDAQRKLNVIRESVRRMGQLIDDLLALSRLGLHALSPSVLDMESVVKETWKELDAGNPEQAELRRDPLPPAFGDRMLVKQVLTNLLVNALKFSKAKGRTVIEVGGRQEGSESVYYVKDHGIGFDMQYYDKLFGIFQTLHSPEEYGGTGVGLAIVQRIVNRHGGRVWAEGVVNEGATFYFSLPAQDNGGGVGNPIFPKA